MKKFLTILLAVTAVATMWAQSVTVDGINYNLAGDSAEVTSGSYTGDITIPATITYETKSYRVTSIGFMAFFMKSITSITIGNNVTKIGKSAFSSCSSLSSVSIPASLKVIGAGAFDGCTSLPVEGYIRYADTYLVGVTDNKQSSYTIKEGTRWIGTDAFQGCKFTTITLPESLICIGDGAFTWCWYIKTIEIPAGVTLVEEHAFSGCSGLTSITCHATVPPVCGNEPFSQVTKTIPVYVPSESVNAYKAADGWKSFTKIQAMTTALQEINSVEATKAEKRIENGRLLIQKGGKTYTANGDEIR